jgi:DNA uptake protein ComE-like DNA-binding protein
MNLNAASVDELTTLPDVDAASAYDLLLWRPYRSWEEVALVPGFDEDRAQALRAAGVILGAERAPAWQVN